MSTPKKATTKPKNQPQTVDSTPYIAPRSRTFIGELLNRSTPRSERLLQLSMVLFALFCLVFLLAQASDFAISGDEIIDDTHSTLVINYLKDGSPEALNQPRTLLHLYGNEVQIVIKYLSNILGVDDVYTFRHICCALIAFWGICLAGLCGYRIAGALCGLLSMLLLFFTPRFFGHAINNLKDLPFAVGYLASIYYFIRTLDTYPKVRINYVVGVLIGFFLCIGTRSGGIMLYPMLFMYAGLYYIRLTGRLRSAFNLKQHHRHFVRILALVGVIFAVGYLTSIFLWPWALQHPLQAIPDSLKQFTNIGTGIKTIFEGKQLMSDMLPAYYAPKYLLITTPLVCIMGVAGAIVTAIVRCKKVSLEQFFLFFTAIAPLSYIVYKHSNLYGGIRHLLFLLPIVAILAANFWSITLQRSKGWYKLIPATLLLLLLALPVRHYICNHPYQYIYFNELVGGLRGVYADYESDYYYNSLKASADYIKTLPRIQQGHPTIVATNHSAIMQHYFRKHKHVQIVYTKYYEKYAKDWDYAAFANVYINPYQQKNGIFPPHNTILTQEVDQQPIGCLIERGDKSYLSAIEQIAWDKDEAIAILSNYVAHNPYYEELYSILAKLYFSTGNFDEAIRYGTKAIELHPQYNDALFFLSYALIKQKKYNKAMPHIATMFNENAKSPDALFLKAHVEAATGNIQQAITHLMYAVKTKPQQSEAFVLYLDLLSKQQQWNDVVGLANTALSHHPSNVKLLIQKSNALCHLMRFAQASALLEEAMAINPNYYEIYKVYARILLAQGKTDEASQLLSNLAFVTTDADLYCVRALLQMHMGNTTLAKEYLQEAMHIDPYNAEPRLMLQSL